MSPNSRQSTIPFRAKKKTTCVNYKKSVEDECSDASEDVKKTPRRSMRHNGPSLLELTPSSALATLKIASPVSLHTKSTETETTEQMPCRENEINELEEFLAGNLTAKTPGSMYISGLPGTGKTASLTFVLENKKICSGYQTVFVNCTAVKSANSIYLRIADELKIKLKTRSEKSAVTSIENFVTKKSARNQKMILLILDEIDQLESKFQTVLYRIFEWPSVPKSRLVLIGIANAVDLTDRVLPRLQALSMQPRLLHFRPYTKDQIVTILRYRMAESNNSDLFAPGALELISAKVAGQSGDLRRALDLGRRVLEVSTKPKTPKKVDLVKSPRKRLLSTQDENEEMLRKTPKKVVLIKESPRKSIQVKNEEMLKKTPKKDILVATRKSPRKISMTASPVRKTERTPCKEIFSPSPVKTVIEPSPLKSPRKRLFNEMGKSPLKDLNSTPVRRSPRKQLFGNGETSPKKDVIRASDVMSVVKLMYGSARNLRTEESAFPLHQKLLISTLLLILTKGKNKDITIGKLHEAYTRVCAKRGISGVDQSGFISLCRQVEMTGAVEIGKGPGKLAKITLQWDETEVSHALQDTSLLTTILSDSTVLFKK